MKKKIDAFRHTLKKSTPVITVDTAWGDVKGRFVGQEDYERLNEEQREQAFAKFITRLKEKQQQSSSSTALLSAEEGEEFDDRRRHHKKRSRRHDGDDAASDYSDVSEAAGAGKRRGTKRHRGRYSSESETDHGNSAGRTSSRKKVSPERGPSSYGGRTLVSYDDDYEEGEVR